MQTKNPFLDEFSKIANGALGFAQTMGDEAKTFWQSKMEQMLLDMDLVRRDEYDNVVDRLKATENRIAALEEKLANNQQVEDKPEKVAAKKAAKPKAE